MFRVKTSQADTEFQLFLERLVFLVDVFRLRTTRRFSILTLDLVFGSNERFFVIWFERKVTDLLCGGTKFDRDT